MKAFILIFSAFLLSAFVGCRPRKLPSTFISKNGLYRFTLNEDSSFEYNYKYYFKYKSSSGTFKRINAKEMIFNSLIQERILPLKVKELYQEQKKGNIIFKINFNLPSNESKYYNCQAFINGTASDYKPCDSLSLFKVSGSVERFSLSIFGSDKIPGRFLDTLFTEVYIRENLISDSLYVDVLFNDSFFNYQVFKGSKIKTSKNNLIFFDDGKRVKLYRK
jgi:hypothetical protein